MSPALGRLTTIPRGLDTLAATLEVARTTSFFYKRLFRKRLREAVTPDIIEDRFTQLPFTSKEDVVRNYPDGFLCVDMAEVALYCESTGTSGNTIGSTKSSSFYTQNDLDRDCDRRYSPDLALTKADIVANTLPFALTSSGSCFDIAARRIGATVINLDSGSLLSSPRKHIEVVQGLKATILICSQPFLYSTLLALDGLTPKQAFPSLRAIQLCGLPTLANAKRKMSEIFEVPVYDTYGLSEFGATTFTCRCGEMHVHENSFFIEVIDPRTGDTVPSGTGGEIVVTTLDREGSPKIRYRTADFGIMTYGVCECGRESPRLAVKGRLRDAAQFESVQYGPRFRLPIDFEEVIHEFAPTTGLYRLHYTPDETSGVQSDQASATTNIVRAKISVDSSDQSKDLASRIKSRLEDEFGPHVEVELLPIGGSTPNLVNMDMYSTVRTIKSAAFEDGRPAEWLVTY